jgi:hypothetical protein
MKTLKFRQALSKLIIDGKKNVTWRLFDDKNLSKGDLIQFIVWETGKEFAQALITHTKETTFGPLSKADWEGHEKYNSKKEQYETFSKYYNRKVDKDSPVKVIKFTLIKWFLLQRQKIRFNSIGITRIQVGYIPDRGGVRYPNPA